jgi:3-oxoacyl-[acyl-carrier-protein] synthase II
MNRVVVTGVGIVSCYGAGLEPFEKAIFEGRSGVVPIKNFDASGWPCRIAAELPAYDSTPYISPKNAKRYDRYIVAAVCASKMAIEMTGLDLETIDKERAGAYIASGIGGLDTFLQEARNLVEKGWRRVSPFFIPNAIVNMASGVVAMETGLMGPNFAIVSACASSTQAIGEAFRLIKHEYAEVMLAGGSETSVDEFGVAGFTSMKAITTSFNDEPHRSSRPFDAKRDGFVMGEGAATLILESLDHAEARGARILAEVVGYGASADAYHITAPAPEGKGAQIAMNAAIKDTGIAREQIGYINAHGTSTELNDKNETMAIKAVFGDYAYKMPLSSTKSMHGHLLGSAGAVECIATILALIRQELPPTINYENPDPECDLDYVPNVARKHEFEYALSNSFGFGGQNAVVCFRRWRG